MRALPLLVLVAACGDPPFALRFAVTDGDSQKCVGDSGSLATDCNDITMSCEPVLSIRIIPPNDPTVPYISVCKKLTGAQSKLCAIAGVDLPDPIVPVPEQVLEVQMAIFPDRDIAHDAMNNPICPIVKYGANNLPIDNDEPCDQEDPTQCPKVPAIGGRTFYYPGDDKTVVHLGCTDLAQLASNSCQGSSKVRVSATVTDFDTGQNVTTSLASRLTVSIGEPTPIGDAFELKGGNEHELLLETSASQPAWFGTVSPFVTFQCLDVREDTAQSTAAVSCDPAAMPAQMMFDISGSRLATSTLDKILAALARTSFPSKGLVVGIVNDSLGTPAAGVTVIPSAGSVQYLSQDLSSIDLSGNGTTASGVFVSQDAPFGTRFDAQAPADIAKSVYGGLIQDKVTIVQIQLQPSTGG